MVTLIVETGVGVAGANTYASRATVDTYHDERGNVAWAAISASTRDVWILRAAEMLDASYAWRGEIASETQAMRWPRSGVCDRDGREIAASVVPASIVRAQSELALLLSAGQGVGGSFGSVSTSPGGIKRAKAGAVEVEYQSTYQAAPPASPSNVLLNGAGEYVDRILAGLFVSPQSAMVKLSKS
jgi:hypothetical protein